MEEKKESKKDKAAEESFCSSVGSLGGLL